MKQYFSELLRKAYFLLEKLDGKVQKIVTGIFIMVSYILYLIMLEPMDWLQSCFGKQIKIGYGFIADGFDVA